MRAKLDEVIRNYDGQPFEDTKTETVQDVDADGQPVVDERGLPVMVTRRKPVRLRDMLLSAYSMVDNAATAEEKIERGTLATRIYMTEEGGELPMTAEQVASAKKLIAKIAGNPVAAMRTIALIDPPAVPEDMRG